MNKFFSSAISFILVIMAMSYLTLGTPIPFLSDKPHSNFNSSMDYATEAQGVVESYAYFSRVSDADIDRMIKLYEKSLKYAQKIDINVLNAEYPGFGDHYRDEFIAGTQTLIDGLKANNESTIVAGQRMIDKWKRWLGANWADIATL